MAASSSDMPSSEVQLFISARSLVNMDSFSKSDPICQVSIYDRKPGQKEGMWRVLGRTEQIKDNLNPVWTKTFKLTYFFEETQRLQFSIYDVDNPSDSLSDDDFLGQTEITLGEIVASQGQQAVRNLNRHGKSGGQLIVRSEEVSSVKAVITLGLGCRDLPKADFFGSADPFLQFSRSFEDGTFTAVHKSEVVKSSVNPDFPTCVIDCSALCNGDFDRTIKVDVLDWERFGDPEYMCELTTSVNVLVDMKRAGSYNNMIDLYNAQKERKPAGKLIVHRADIQRDYTFMEYLAGGLSLSLIVAVDFTASNQPIHTPSSLHYTGSGQPNQYQQAIQAVGDIVLNYCSATSGRAITAYGFGAQLPPTYQVSHCFALNGNPSNPVCIGVDGLLAAYKQAISVVRLYGPTNFAPIIRTASEKAKAAAASDAQSYQILLIMTDGLITDKDLTIAAIVDASYLPISIIIVGVGAEDFSAMNMLDSDDRKLSSGGKTALRDCVQFVPFKNYLSQHHSALARDVLAEVPAQVVEYYKSKNIFPQAKLAPPPPPPFVPLDFGPDGQPLHPELAARAAAASSGAYSSNGTEAPPPYAG